MRWGYQCLREKPAASAVKTASGINLLSIHRRLSKEVDEYQQLPAATNSKDDVLGYWHDAGTARLDPHGSVIAAAQFTILVMLARVYLCIDNTNCQLEREFPGVAFVYSDLSRRRHPSSSRK